MFYSTHFIGLGRNTIIVFVFYLRYFVIMHAAIVFTKARKLTYLSGNAETLLHRTSHYEINSQIVDSQSAIFIFHINTSLQGWCFTYTFFSHGWNCHQLTEFRGKPLAFILPFLSIRFLTKTNLHRVRRLHNCTLSTPHRMFSHVVRSPLLLWGETRDR